MKKSKTVLLVLAGLGALLLFTGCEFFANLFTPPYVGSWKGQEPENEMWILVVIEKDGSFTQSISAAEDMTPLGMSMRGTIVVDGNQGSITFTELLYDWDGDDDVSDEEWRVIAELLQQYPSMQIETEHSFTFTVSGDTMTTTDTDEEVIVFTKQ